MVAVVSGQGPGGVEHVADSGIVKAVDDLASPALSLDESAPAQAGQVVRHPTLRCVYRLDQLRHGVRSLQQSLEDPQAGGVTQYSEEPGGGSRQLGMRLDSCCHPTII